MYRKNKSKAKKQNMIPIYVLGAFASLSLIAMIVALCIPKEPIKGEFVPPPFDSTAVVGTPEVSKELGYSSPYREGMAYRFSVCGNVRLNGKTATVYLTNDAENQVYLKLRVLDDNGKILGETGLLKPHEYVKNVELNKELPVGTSIKLKIMSYDPETYMSMGSALLTTAIVE